MTHSSNSNQWRWSVPTIAAIALMAVLFGYSPPAQKIVSTPEFFATLTNTNGEVIGLATFSQNTVALQWLKSVEARPGSLSVIYSGSDNALGKTTISTNIKFSMEHPPKSDDTILLQDSKNTTFASGTLYSLKH